MTVIFMGGDWVMLQTKQDISCICFLFSQNQGAAGGRFPQYTISGALLKEDMQSAKSYANPFAAQEQYYKLGYKKRGQS
jgi:hypothetical protein